ncbi:hypothetical protein [Streptomyces sp. Z26]|uniref:hypothetical protein n=1 Tax=Streptomyces sp. Z26 TaxID=2500177 RepID=UPI001F0BFFA7|nr:hypothetical protein [Streptomyces sp. Z26]
MAAATAAGVGAALVCTVAVTGCSPTGPAGASRGSDGAGGPDVADSADPTAGPGAGGGRGGERTADGDALTAVRRAADALERAGTSRTRTSVRMASGGTRVTVRGAGGFDYARRTGRIEVTLPRGPSGAEAGEPLTQVFRRGALYMKNRGAGVPADKWVRVEAAALPDGNLVTSGATDPLTAAELLRGTDELRYVGAESLHGTAVRHYRGTADLDAAARTAKGPARAQLAAAARGFAGDAVSFDVFIDGQARPRKVQHRFTFGTGADAGTEGGSSGTDDSGRGGAGGGGGAGGPGADATVTSTTEMFGFGAPVDVALPSAEHIYTGRIATP